MPTASVVASNPKRNRSAAGSGSRARAVSVFRKRVYISRSRPISTPRFLSSDRRRFRPFTHEQIKTTKKTRVHTATKKVTKAMLARKKWAKFGDAQRYKPGDESMTAVSIEEIFLERARATPKSESEKSGDALAAMASTGNTSLLVCRICGKKGDHWTTKCPYKDLAAMNTLGLGSEKPPGDDDPSAPSKGGYVPPSMRAGAGAGASMGDSFVNKDDAQRAIDKLDGYGYDSLILRVEWAAPREERK